MNDISINSATGLPRLPAGWFWRVVESDKDYRNNPWIEVRAMRRVLKRRWWLGQTVHEETVAWTWMSYAKYCSDPVGNLRYMAKYLYKHHLHLDEKYNLEQAKLRTRVVDTLKDYPPNRLQS